MNSKRLRDVVFIIHRYVGLGVGILAAVIGMTGSLLILNDLWHDLHFIRMPSGTRLSVASLVTKAQSAFPNLKLDSLDFPKAPTHPIVAWWLDDEAYIKGWLHPYTGAVISVEQDATSYTTRLLDIHINLMSGQWGYNLAGIVGLLATLLCITGIVLWPGWRKLAAGFKIKWNAKTKRLNFDLHKVVGIVVAIFLSMAMFTGFTWNFMQWTYPIIYAVTFSPPFSLEPATESEAAPASTPIANQTPLPFSDSLLQSANSVLPAGIITTVALPTVPTGVITITKEMTPGVTASVAIDQFSGKVLKVNKPDYSEPSLGFQVTELFYPVHFGTFAGIYSQIFYVFVGLSPTILLVTGFIMWRHRKKPRQPAVE
jgi:uncharacterized iron-regulated membrane protein